MGVVSISGGAGSNAIVGRSPLAEGRSVPGNAPSPKTAQDTVRISGAARAKSLKLQGQNPQQIAQQMGVDVKTVDKYLGIKPDKAASGQTAKTVPAEPCWITDIVSSSGIP
ncbi:hypothetical protein [Geobacter sp. AOG2]|uniref:hypothetical protein n=1 Tax=Geobacter sp. AOG2 TaxID=1566347 RepID=UPI001CC3DA6F|nr:hypothetical protein [Geobacter sp. AOG2]GFE62908.1 hypothetical protein AOG2_34970 [Geobacter sp. AOG2]